MKRRRTKLMILFLVVAAAAAGHFVFLAPRHVLIDQGVAVGEDVSLTSQGTALAASILKPAAAAGPSPGVVMIVGSGAYSFRTSWKDGEFPLWKNISEAFLAKGYAVLLLEKKGVNRSGGHWEEQTFPDRAEDAIAGVRYLRTRPDIDPARVGVCGHSQGGWIAQLAAAMDPEEIAFVVSLAGPNISVVQQVIDDQANEWRCAGIPEEKVGRKSRWLRTKLGVLSALSRVVKIGSLSRIINYDPEAERVPARITCPVLAVYGEWDLLVMPETNIPLLKQGLAAGGNARSTIVVVPAGSHGFTRKASKCRGGSTGIPVQAPEFFKALSDWDPFAR